MSKSKDIVFAGQRDREEVIMVVYKHWWIAILPMLKALLIILASLFLPVWLGFAFVIYNYTISTLVYFAWLIFWGVYIFYSYYNWLEGKFVITNERIVKIDQKRMFSRTVSEVELNKVDSIIHSTKGVFATMFNFGTVVIKTLTNELTLEHVPNPVYIKEEIIELTKGA